MVLEVCRVCLNDEEQLLNLFENMTDEGITLAEIYAITANLPLAQNDQWPQWICTNCLSHMLQVFKTMVQIDMNISSYYNYYNN